MDFLFPYAETKVKPYLKMAIQRIHLTNNKRQQSVKIQKKAIADLLRDNKEVKAMIKVEHIIREDYTMEGYEILELLLELVHERIRQVTNSTECPSELVEPISSIIWASHNVDLDELKNVASQFQKKYGKEFVQAALKPDSKLVNSRLLEKLTYRVPGNELVLSYLSVIGETYNVGWAATPQLLEEIKSRGASCVTSPSGLAAADGAGPASGITVAYSSKEEPTSAELEERRQFLQNQQQPVAAVASVVVYPVPLAAPAPATPPLVVASAPVAPVAQSPVDEESQDPLQALQARLAALNRPTPPPNV